MQKERRSDTSNLIDSTKRSSQIAVILIKRLTFFRNIYFPTIYYLDKESRRKTFPISAQKLNEELVDLSE